MNQMPTPEFHMTNAEAALAMLETEAAERGASIHAFRALELFDGAACLAVCVEPGHRHIAVRLRSCSIESLRVACESRGIPQCR